MVSAAEAGGGRDDARRRSAGALRRPAVRLWVAAVLPLPLLWSRCIVAPASCSPEAVSALDSRRQPPAQPPTPLLSAACPFRAECSLARRRSTARSSRWSTRTGTSPIVDPATGQTRRVTTEGVLDRQSQFAEFTVISPDNRLVVYQWQALDGKSELRLIEIDGKRPRVLIRSDALEEPIPIQWSRDGK